MATPVLGHLRRIYIGYWIRPSLNGCQKCPATTKAYGTAAR
jgi:hypothetical protein